MFSSFVGIAKEIFHNYTTGAVSLRIILEFMWFKARGFSTHIFENGKHTVTGNTHCVTYFDGDRRYHVISPKKRGPKQITSVYCDDEDVTEHVFECMGPCHNFHGIPTTPRMLGYEELTVTYRNGDSVTYPSDRSISISHPGLQSEGNVWYLDELLRSKSGKSSPETFDIPPIVVAPPDHP